VVDELIGLNWQQATAALKNTSKATWFSHWHYTSLVPIAALFGFDLPALVAPLIAVERDAAKKAQKKAKPTVAKSATKPPARKAKKTKPKKAPKKASKKKAVKKAGQDMKPTEIEPDQYQCPKCLRILAIEDMDVLGFKDCGCPDCGVEISKMRKFKKAAACRVCGCTDDDCSGCVAKTGGPCYWVEPDLCSACATPMQIKESRASCSAAPKEPKKTQPAKSAKKKAPAKPAKKAKSNVSGKSARRFFGVPASAKP